MDKTTMGFIGLLAILFIGQVFMNENFADTSGADISGSKITLSLSDLISLMTNPAPPTPTAKKDEYESEYEEIRDDILAEVKGVVRSELLSGAYGSNNDTITDECIDNFANKQGAEFMRYIPGKNPDDYIRKDSVPCYGCSIPTR